MSEALNEEIWNELHNHGDVQVTAEVLVGEDEDGMPITKDMIVNYSIERDIASDDELDYNIIKRLDENAFISADVPADKIISIIEVDV